MPLDFVISVIFLFAWYGDRTRTLCLPGRAVRLSQICTVILAVTHFLPLKSQLGSACDSSAPAPRWSVSLFIAQEFALSFLELPIIAAFVSQYQLLYPLGAATS